MPDTCGITELLNEWSRGNREALGELTRVVYQELHKLARGYLRRELSRTLQPTALINESLLRLIDQSKPIEWESRAHFFGIAARLMRLVLVDHARTRMADKRKSAALAITLEENLMAECNQPEADVLDLHHALERLSRLDQRKAALIEMRYFAGMSREEIGCAAGLGIPTVKRELRLGEAWLRRELLRTN